MSDVRTVTVEDLDQATRDALQRLVLSLADSKRLMGIRYSDWLLGAPSIETGIAASSMTQDEWGHARLLYAMLKAFGLDPVQVEHERPAEEYASVAPLDEAMPDWAALVAAMLLVDGALSTVLASFAAGAYEPARTRVPKMLSEEEFHASLGAAWYRRLAESGGEARDLLLAATGSMLPPILAWVGADDAPAQALVEAGIIASAPERLADFRGRVGDVLASADVDLGAVEPSRDWDGARGRTAGRPDDSSVERARGDRNRMLLVE